MKPGYYTVPSLENINPKNLGAIQDFVIGRESHGEILFPGKIELSGVDLESVVKINKNSVEVYPDDVCRPPNGCGLNRPAIVTLHQVWPRYKNSYPRFRKCLERVTRNMGAEFMDYEKDSGSWTFRVSHFSKYGLNDSDEESEGPVPAMQNGLQTMRVPSQQGTNMNNTLIKQISLGERPFAETIPKSVIFDETLGNNLEEVMDEDFNPVFYNSGEEMNDRPHIFSNLPFLNSSMHNERFSGLKSSFFQEGFMERDDEEPLIEERLSPLVHTREAEPILLCSLNFHRQVSERELPVLPTDHTDSPLFRTPRRFTSTKLLSKSIQYEKSLLFNRQKFIQDSACFKGFSFRVGWGPRWQLTHKEVILNLPSKQLKLPSTYSGIVSLPTGPKLHPSAVSISNIMCSQLQIALPEVTVFHSLENIWRNLKVQLKHNLYCEQDGIPLFTVQRGVELLKSHFELSQQHLMEDKLMHDVHTVWNLCTALWGHCQDSEEPNTYNCGLTRKEFLSKWLITTTSINLDDEIQHNLNASKYIPAIFSQMTGKRIADACSSADLSNNFRLGFLLSQAGSSLAYKNSVLKLLENWLEFEVDSFVDTKLLKIYALLAGKVVWTTKQRQVINCCEDLDWKRALALHLWFDCPPTSTIQDALTAYEEAFQGTSSRGLYASPPYPNYIQEDPQKLLLAGQDTSLVFDMCYYLLKLYCDRSIPLGKLLVPLTYGHSQLDYSLSWMVFQVLLSLDYTHLPTYQSQLLHVHFASQLEAIGLWHWAVFIVLHMPEASRRKAAVMEILMRHISLSPDEEEKDLETFLKDELHVPISWLYAAKAVVAKSCGAYREEAWCLLKSSQWTECHRIVVEKIATDCIIHEQFDYLKSFLIELALPESSSTILDWPIGGEVFLDYIHVSEAVEKVISGRVQAYEIEEIQPQLISLSNRICKLQCQGAKSHLCQSEMSKKTVTLLRALLTLSRDLRSGAATSTYELATLLPNLPMPEDYAIQELRSMVRSYMLEITETENSP